MSYVLAPLNKVKVDFPEYRGVMLDLEAALRRRAEETWKGFSFGGLTPAGNQYGLNNIPPRHMSVPRGFGSWSFMQKFTAPGSWVNIFSYTVPRDQIHGFAGFGFEAPNMIFNAIRAQIMDVIYPVIEVEEARMFAKEGLALIFKSDRGEEMVVPEINPVVLKGFQERNTSGWNVRVIPIGMMAYRAKDDIISLSAPAT